jgi:hypothetical protein
MNASSIVSKPRICERALFGDTIQLGLIEEECPNGNPGINVWIRKDLCIRGVPLDRPV